MPCPESLNVDQPTHVDADTATFGNVKAWRIIIVRYLSKQLAVRVHLGLFICHCRPRSVPRAASARPFLYVAFVVHPLADARLAGSLFPLAHLGALMCR